MSWIAAFAAISMVAGCVGDPEVSCGDDAGRYGGLQVSFEGREPDVTYDFAIDAEGVSLVVSAPPGQPTEAVTADLAGDRSLSAQMAGSTGDFLNITLLQPAPTPGTDEPYSSLGPAQATVVARAGGTEVGRATFTPTYTHDTPWGPECAYFDVDAVTMTLAAAP